MPYEPRNASSRRRADLLLIVGFFAILVYPSASLFEDPESLKALGAAEKRVLTARPPIWRLLKSPAEFVAGFKSFFEDQFEGRGALVSLNSLVRYKAFHTSTSSKVLAGKHRMLFYTGEPIVQPYDFGHESAMHRGVLPISEKRLERIHDLLLKRKQWADSLGAEFLFVIAPDKTSIYPELLPDWFDTAEGPTFTERLVERLQAAGDVDFIDLRPVLENAKHLGRPLFYAGDTHWNYEGAFVGYQEIARWLQSRFPAVKPLGDDDVIRTRVRHEGDLTGLLHLKSYFEEPATFVRVKAPRIGPATFPGDPTPIPTWSTPPFALQVPDPRLPKALIYHDSFATWLTPYLAENFQTSAFIRDRVVIKKTIEGYKPDVVIFECVERNLFTLANFWDDLNPEPEPTLTAETLDLMNVQRR